MATVTGMTAAAMQAIRDNTVVSAAFDSANHLILTKYDGTQIDAGTVAAATAVASGVVELATNAETLTGTDDTRAVTPAGLASIPGAKVQHLGSNTKTESQTYVDYPSGVSTLYLTTGSGWSVNNGFGTVMTVNLDGDRCYQTFYTRAGSPTGLPRVWTRSYHTTDGGGGWTLWHQFDISLNVTPTTGITQTTAFTAFPPGYSRMYFTTSSGTGWDFSGMAGEVTTYINGTDFGKQIFTQHVGGSSAKPAQWFRTANAASGWSAWQPVLADPGAWVSYTPTWTTQGGAHLPSFGNATIDCRSFKIGRKVDVKFEVTFGSTTNFGSGATTSDNWQFSLPYTAARSTDGVIGYVDMYQSATANGFGRAKMASGSTTLFQISISAGSTSAIGGDADSLSPFTWASGNTLKGMLTYESAS